MNDSAKTPDIFIAYSSKDEPAVRKIVDWLKNQGLQVWVAYEQSAGQNWDEDIDRVLQVAPCVLVVWSENSIRSAEVKGEARAAMERGVLIPVSLSGALPPRSFTHLHAVDLSDVSRNEKSPRTQQVLSGIKGRLSAHGEEAQVAVAVADNKIATPSSSTASASSSRARLPIAALSIAVIAVVLIAAYFGSGALADPSCDDNDALVLNSRSFDTDETITGDIVCLVDNANYRVSNGSQLTIAAKTLIIQGPARFDGRGSTGVNGRAGANGRRETHTPPRVVGIAVCGFPPAADRYHGQDGQAGRNGGPGAQIVISYEQLLGNPGQLGVDVEGGPGGNGGVGGTAGYAQCRDSTPYMVNGRPGRNGNDGAAGAEGSFSISQI